MINRLIRDYDSDDEDDGEFQFFLSDPATLQLATNIETLYFTVQEDDSDTMTDFIISLWVKNRRAVRKIEVHFMFGSYELGDSHVPAFEWDDETWIWEEQNGGVLQVRE